ncbi:glycerophosphodiester phosphodiesterase [Patescibacteria group bacterium]|nr:glycerophosphodiester phosphodiesterase [Patescibacteria group bacterium]
MIIAHRGYAKNHPENTIAAFDAAFMAGVDAIETDVREVPDGSVVVSHDPVQNANGLLSLGQLFDYIKSKQTSFFLELKTASPVLLESVIERISQNNLWERVYLIGFASRIKTALKAQDKHLKLRVCQIIMIPQLSFLKPPKKSYAVFFGWLDGIKYSKQLFKILTPKILLHRLKRYYEKQGFKVMAGVINDEKGFKLFHDAGIYDIFTDEVETAKLCRKQQQQY